MGTPQDLIDRLQPLRIGRSVDLRRLSEFAAVFGMDLHTARRTMDCLRIPLFHIGPEAYFHIEALEQVVFALTRPGSPGFMAPGSRERNRHRGRLDKSSTLSALTPELWASLSKNLSSSMDATASRLKAHRVAAIRRTLASGGNPLSTTPPSTPNAQEAQEAQDGDE